MNSHERVLAAHKRSIQHRNEVELSKACGCFHCGYIPSPKEINHWIDKNGKGIGQTAMCPKCGIDSVIGDKSDFPITKDFLSAMCSHWFGGEFEA
jgi:hypothetical protein